MKLLRSFPYEIPAGNHPHVVDSIQRHFMANGDYTGLAAYDDDILLLEWDMAVSKEDLERFVWRSAGGDKAYQVQVAPYRLYEGRDEPVWAHRKITGQGIAEERWVIPDDETCDYFAFGMIYLPRDLLRAFESTDRLTRAHPIGIPVEFFADYRFNDGTFSMWHYEQGHGPVPIYWDIRPVHLHY